jgi:hypothetical protein
MARSIHDVLLALGARAARDGHLALDLDLLDTRSLFGAPLGGEGLIEVSSPEAFRFLRPPELEICGALWLPGIEEPAELARAIVDAHETIRARLDDDQATLRRLGLAPRLVAPAPRAAALLPVGAHQALVSVDDNGDLILESLDGRRVPPELGRVLAVEDAVAEEVHERLEELVAELGPQLEEGEALPSMDGFDVDLVSREGVAFDDEEGTATRSGPGQGPGQGDGARTRHLSDEQMAELAAALDDDGDGAVSATDPGDDEPAEEPPAPGDDEARRGAVRGSGAAGILFEPSSEGPAVGHEHPRAGSDPAEVEATLSVPAMKDVPAVPSSSSAPAPIGADDDGPSTLSMHAQRKPSSLLAALDGSLDGSADGAPAGSPAGAPAGSPEGPAHGSLEGASDEERRALEALREIGDDDDDEETVNAGAWRPGVGGLDRLDPSDALDEPAMPPPNGALDPFDRVPGSGLTVPTPTTRSPKTPPPPLDDDGAELKDEPTSAVPLDNSRTAHLGEELPPLMTATGDAAGMRVSDFPALPSDAAEPEPAPTSVSDPDADHTVGPSVGLEASRPPAAHQPPHGFAPAFAAASMHGASQLAGGDEANGFDDGASPLPVPSPAGALLTEHNREPLTAAIPTKATVSQPAEPPHLEPSLAPSAEDEPAPDEDVAEKQRPRSPPSPRSEERDAWRTADDEEGRDADKDEAEDEAEEEGLKTRAVFISASLMNRVRRSTDEEDGAPTGAATAAGSVGAGSAASETFDPSASSAPPASSDAPDASAGPSAAEPDEDDLRRDDADALEARAAALEEEARALRERAGELRRKTSPPAVHAALERPPAAAHHLVAPTLGSKDSLSLTSQGPSTSHSMPVIASVEVHEVAPAVASPRPLLSSLDVDVAIEDPGPEPRELVEGGVSLAEVQAALGELAALPGEATQIGALQDGRFTELRSSSGDDVFESPSTRDRGAAKREPRPPVSREAPPTRVRYVEGSESLRRAAPPAEVSSVPDGEARSDVQAPDHSASRSGPSGAAGPEDQRAGVIGLVVEDAKARDRLKRHLSSRFARLVEAESASAAAALPGLAHLDAFVFVRPRPDGQTREGMAALRARAKNARILVISSDARFDDVPQVSLRLPLGQRASEVARQVLEGLRALGIEARDGAGGG